MGSVVSNQPGLARVFEQLGIDYCCGGKKPLAQAFAERGIEPAAGLTMLAAFARSGTTSGGDLDVANLSLTELANHIERSHHAYVREALPRLVEMSERVARKHGERDPRLPEVFTTVLALADEMTHHMEKEERILFPIVRELEAGASPEQFHCGSIANPIRQMEAEHASAGDALARLRTLTNDFQPDENACNTHRALLAGIAEFEADLHRHVHKENNVLFPRALELAAAGTNANA